MFLAKRREVCSLPVAQPGDLMKPPIDVYKFGGVAVGSAEAIRMAIDNVRRVPRLAVVVSAMNGITE